MATHTNVLRWTIQTEAGSFTLYVDETVTERTFHNGRTFTLRNYHPSTYEDDQEPVRQSETTHPTVNSALHQGISDILDTISERERHNAG